MSAVGPRLEAEQIGEVIRYLAVDTLVVPLVARGCVSLHLPVCVPAICRCESPLIAVSVVEYSLARSAVGVRMTTVRLVPNIWVKFKVCVMRICERRVPMPKRVILRSFRVD